MWEGKWEPEASKMATIADPEYGEKATRSSWI